MIEHLTMCTCSNAQLCHIHTLLLLNCIVFAAAAAAAVCGVG